MSKTKRKVPTGVHRSIKEKPNKVEKTFLQDLAKNEAVKLTNREVNKVVADSWDDLPIGTYGETKHLWKNGVKIVFEDGFYNVFFQKHFIVNLTKEELQFFPWTQFLPIDCPPDLGCFKLV